jgi:hypothetical protein
MALLVADTGASYPHFRIYGWVLWRTSVLQLAQPFEWAVKRLFNSDLKQLCETSRVVGHLNWVATAKGGDD